MPRRSIILFAACLAAVVPASGADDDGPKVKPKFHLIVFDLATVGADKTVGPDISDRIRIRIRRHREYWAWDRLSTQEASGPMGIETDPQKVAALMRDKLGFTLGIYGTAQQDGKAVRAEVRCVDLTEPDKVKGWTDVFSDDTERARGLIARWVIEKITGREEWKPPEYGDDPEPKQFRPPLNLNGDFEQGAKGWMRTDNVSNFLEPGPAGRGMVLRIRTDLARDPWLAYQRDLLLGKADPARPPKIARDTSYGSVAGLEGVHFKGDWVRAAPGQRYWLSADYTGPGGGAGKIFVKGFRKTEHALDGLPESSLAELHLTPEQFANLPAEKRKQLIQAEEKKDPKRFLRECYRWYLNCRGQAGQWNHLAAPFPPRGGLPDYVEWLQIQVYAYWPPGTYYYDNVFLYADPNQKAPLPEEKPRTPNFGKTSDVVERDYQEKLKQKDKQ